MPAVDETKNQIRFRQFDPSVCDQGSFWTAQLSETDILTPEQKKLRYQNYLVRDYMFPESGGQVVYCRVGGQRRIQSIRLPKHNTE